jgi:hypothetical protein
MNMAVCHPTMYQRYLSMTPDEYAEPLNESKQRTLEWIAEHWQLPLFYSFVWGCIAYNEERGSAFRIRLNGSIEPIPSHLMPEISHAANFQPRIILDFGEKQYQQYIEDDPSAITEY